MARRFKVGRSAYIISSMMSASPGRVTLRPVYRWRYDNCRHIGQSASRQLEVQVHTRGNFAGATTQAIPAFSEIRT